jgi:hypothetical protein
VSNRGGARAAELRAERIGWKERSRGMNQASLSMDTRLGRMRERAEELDVRLRRHREQRTSWHRKWDDRGRPG